MSAQGLPSLPPITALNSLPEASKPTFLSVLANLFEPAPPLVDRLWSARPFLSYINLIDQAEQIVLGPELASPERLEVVNAHPRIGESSAKLSALSLREQGYDSSSTQPQLSEEETTNQELARLNKLYEDKFGFKFIVFVNGRSRKAIIPVLEERLLNDDAQAELTTGLKEMMAIARSRAQSLAADGR